MSFKSTVMNQMGRILPDKLWIQMKFVARTGKFPNLRNPKSFNEKLQWLKLYNRKPEYCAMVDKYEVKKIIAERIGEEYVIPTLGVWNRVEDIDFDSLPDQFVLKCTHDSGGLVICKDKTQLDLDAAKKKLQRSMNTSYFWHGREWPYKSVKPRIIAEKYMVDESGVELKDYKVFNFNGVPKMIQVNFNRFVNHTINLYDIEWNYLDMELNYPTDPKVEIKKPECLDEMLALAKKLSAEIPFLRTDFYVVDGKIYFGELTFFPGSGFNVIKPDLVEREMGSWIALPEKRKKK